MFCLFCLYFWLFPVLSLANVMENHSGSGRIDLVKGRFYQSRLNTTWHEKRPFGGKQTSSPGLKTQYSVPLLFERYVQPPFSFAFLCISRLSAVCGPEIVCIIWYTVKEEWHTTFAFSEFYTYEGKCYREKVCGKTAKQLFISFHKYSFLLNDPQFNYILFSIVELYEFQSGIIVLYKCIYLILKKAG